MNPPYDVVTGFGVSPSLVIKPNLVGADYLNLVNLSCVCAGSASMVAWMSTMKTS
jgi:hypothetical protein